MMPKGVEHSEGRLDNSRQSNVRIPMMPKGVEHFEFLGACRAPAKPVRIPMMPKGVEHPLLLASSTMAVGVRITMMPKGVEHSRSIWLFPIFVP